VAHKSHRGNDAATRCYRFLKLINSKGNRALKWDLEKMAGSLEQFRSLTTALYVTA